MKIKPFYAANVKTIIKQIKHTKMKAILNFKMAGVVLLFSLLSLNISAQGPGGPGRGPQFTEEDIQERAEKTAEILELNDEQSKKILAIDVDFYNKMQVERQKMRNAERSPENRDAMREKMTTMRDERNEQYEKVLTPEQYTKFVEMQEQRRREMQQKRRERTDDSEARPERGRGRNKSS